MTRAPKALYTFAFCIGTPGTFELVNDLTFSKYLLGQYFLSRYAILNEVWRLVADGVVDVQDIDKVISEGLGMRYAFLGSLETAHLNAEGMASYIERFVLI